MESLIDWMYGFGEEYGVNPLIFALLYFGTIPFSLLSFSFLVRNYRKGKSLFLPIFGMFICFIGTYIYLFLVGKNIPNWVWAVIIVMMIYGGYTIVSKIKKLKNSKSDLTDFS